jgi:FKBP-type peptidyl-prolyl cis-trans isomerase
MRSHLLLTALAFTAVLVTCSRGAPEPRPNERLSYAMGLVEGSALRERAVEVSPSVYEQGFRDGLAGGASVLSEAAAREQLDVWHAALRQRELTEAAARNRAAGDAFRAVFARQRGVVTLSSGLMYRVVRPGTGLRPGPADTVVLRYRAWRADGTPLVTLTAHGQPAAVVVGDAIPGWREALQRMPVGSTWQLVVPPQLAYGDDPIAGIGPSSTLVFQVELLSVVGSGT